MQNYKIVYTFDGGRFYDVVNAESADTAEEYFLWITESGNDHRVISTEITSDVASYYAPEGWTRPESVNDARRRSLLTALQVLGFDPVGTDFAWSEEIHSAMQQLGYSVQITEDTDFGCVYYRYTKPGSAPLELEK